MLFTQIKESNVRSAYQKRDQPIEKLLRQQHIKSQIKRHRVKNLNDRLPENVKVHKMKTRTMGEKQSIRGKYRMIFLKHNSDAENGVRFK